MRKNIIIFSLIVLIISGATWAGCSLPQTLQDFKDIRSSLSTGQFRVLTLETLLTATRTDFEEAMNALSRKTVELEESRDTLASAADYLKLTQAQLEYSNNQFSQAQAQLATTRGQLTKALNDATTVKDGAKPPRPFNSVTEAQSWLDKNHLPFVLIADSSGTVSFSQSKADARYDCDDYARDYQQLALKSGYIINLCPVINGQVWGITVSPLLEAHIACWVQIDNIYYYIESVPGLNNSYQLIRITSAD
jgi:hypothetical protein